MAASNVRRYLVSLVTAGLAEQDPQSLKYQLGVASIQLGLSALAQRSEIDIALTEARSLRDEVDCCVGLLCPGESGPIMIRWLENGDRVTHVGKLGATFSLIHSAAGRAFLAAMPEDIACAAFARETAQADTPREAGQPLDLKGFLAMLRRCRKTGFSHVRGDYTTGIEAVGAVAYNAAGEVAFILTVVGRSGIFAGDGKPEAPEALKRSVSRLSAMLGHADFRRPLCFPERLQLANRDL
jgi:DNA-binding IclR family transcriptional regulator